MKKPAKEYILWIGNGNGEYVPKEFDSIEEALCSDRYNSDWYLTSSVNRISAYGGYDKPTTK